MARELAIGALESRCGERFGYDLDASEELRRTAAMHRIR